MNKHWKIEKDAALLHEKSVVWDCHGCMPQSMEQLPMAISQLSQYRDAGVDIAHINLGDSYFPLDSLVRVAAYLRHWIKAHDGEYQLISSVDDIYQAKKNGKLAVAFDIEGGQALQEQVSLLEFFYDLGVRWMLLSYNKSNLLAGGCHDEDTGLTELGRRFVDEMARIGMITCCSHTGYRTAMDIFEYASNPVIFSHSNPRSLVDHPRNVPDELMKACANTGGVQCINGIGFFLGGDTSTPDTIVRHIDYACELIGAEHVGIGLDYVFTGDFASDFSPEDHSDYWPAEYYQGSELNDDTLFCPSQLPQLTEALMKRGYSDDNIRGILGENMIRVARQVWK